MKIFLHFALLLGVGLAAVGGCGGPTNNAPEGAGLQGMSEPSTFTNAAALPSDAPGGASTATTSTAPTTRP